MSRPRKPVRRNPVAASLRLGVARPKVVPDKRAKLKLKAERKS